MEPVLPPKSQLRARAESRSMHTFLATLAAFAVFVAAAGIQSPTAAQAGSGAKKQNAQDALHHALEAINDARKKNGKTLLRRDERLDATAYRHAAHMAATQTLAHVIGKSGTPEDRVEDMGIEATLVGENLAQHKDINVALKAIFESKPHRAELLEEKYSHIGLAAAQGKDGIYVTQLLVRIEKAQPKLAPPHRSQKSKKEAAKVATPHKRNSAKKRAAKKEPENGKKANKNKAKGPSIRLGKKHLRVKGLWMWHHDRWWHFSIPKGARAGQMLDADKWQFETPSKKS